MSIKKIVVFALLSLLTFTLYSQIDTLSERQLYNWTINPFDLSPDYSEIDTTLNDFQLFNPLLKSTISTNYLGNLGTASQSKVYYDRKINNTGFLFSEPYSVYFHLPYKQTYFNTKRQFTLLKYGSGGPREESEQTLGVLHTQNVTEDFNVGIDYDLISSAGRYQNQKAQIHSATVFSSYRWKGYRVHANYTLNKVNNEENGGIDSLQYLGSKEYSRTQTIPVKLSDAVFKLQNSSFYLAQEFQFGNYPNKPKKDKNKKSVSEEPIKPKQNIESSGEKTNTLKFAVDTLTIVSQKQNTTDSISIDTLNQNEVKKNHQFLKKIKPTGFSLSHELFYNRDYRKFTDNGLTESFYSKLDTLISSKKTKDAVFQNRFGNKLSAHYRFKDLFSVRLSYYNEQMKYENNIIPDTLINYDSSNQPIDTVIENYLLKDYSNNSVSFYMHSLLFNRILFNGYGEYYLNGYKKEDSRINLMFGYRLFADNWIEFNGEYTNRRPGFFYEKFTSNHFQWDNKYLIRQEEWDANIKIKNTEYRFDMSVGYGQITGHVYLDTSATVQQYGNQINIFTARVNKRFTLGSFHSTTQFVYQTSTNDSLLSLPELNLFQSLYYEKLFKFSATQGELRMQAGVDYRYASAYMADGYMPVTGLFYRQFDQEIADYHCMDIFINFAIKRARLYLIYNYLNSALSESYFFTAPSYPAPPAVFKFGIAWTFYD
jgi:hypothetical protein